MRKKAEFDGEKKNEQNKNDQIKVKKSHGTWRQKKHDTL